MFLENLIGNEKVLLVAPSLMIDKIVPWNKAVNLMLFRDAYAVLEREDRVLKAVDFEMNMPLVVAHGNNYNRKVRKYGFNDLISKKNVRIRDNFTCAYCGNFGDTIDHISPKALGGKSVYGNMCVACKSCNSKKGSKTLAQAKLKQPIIPDTIPFRITPLQEALFEALEMSA